MAGVLVVGLVAGCAASKVDPKASVNVHGILLRADRSTAKAIEVGLFRTPDPAELLTVGVTAGSALVTCLSKQSLPICKTVQQQHADATGTYRFQMRGEDVQGFFGQASPFSLAARLSATGPSVQSDFTVQRTDLAVPTLTFWQPKELSAAAENGQIRVRWDDLSSASGYTADFTDGDSLVWSQPAKSGDTVDPRALEDFQAAFHVTAKTSADGPDTTFATTFRSQQVRTGANAGAPQSRGATCFVAGATGPVRLNPCPLTDGKVDAGFPLQTCPASNAKATPSSCPPITAVWLDLGESRPVRTLFARGLSTAGLSVDTSDDGAKWTKRTSVSSLSAFEKISLPATVNARYVRLATRQQGDPITALTEFSVWPNAS